MDEKSFLQLDKHRVQASFAKAAPGYDKAAVLQREVGKRLLERLRFVRISPALIVDIGCATGAITAELFNRYRKAQIIGLDIAYAMLPLARGRTHWLRRFFSVLSRQNAIFSVLSRQNAINFLCADTEALPLKNGSCDLLFSNLTLQWCNDPEQVFAEFIRVLRPGGLLMFSTLGPDTLIELRRSWAKVDAHTHVSSFIDMHDIGDALLRARFADPVMDAERLTLTYKTVMELMRDLKTLGSRNASVGRARNLTGKNRLQAMIDHYETLRRDNDNDIDGVIPATYEVVYGHAWKSDKDLTPRQDQAVATFPLSRLKRR